MARSWAHESQPRPEPHHTVASTTRTMRRGEQTPPSPAAVTGLEPPPKGTRGKRPRTRARPSGLPVTLANEMGRLLDAIPDGVLIADESGDIQFANQHTSLLFGYDQKALLGQPVEALMPERFRGVHPVHRAEYSATPRQRPMGTGLQLFGLRQDGSEFPVEISLSPITVADTPLVLATIRDVTRRRLLERQAHKAVEDRLAMLQVILDELPCSVYLVRGRDAELVLANRRVTDIWGATWLEGQPMEAFLASSGARVFDLQGRALPPERFATLRALRSGRSVRQHQEIISRPDGSLISVLVNAVTVEPDLFPILSGVMSVGGIGETPAAPKPLVLVVHQDVGALMEAERIKDEFVAMAAHELRTPVASLLGYAQLLVQAAGSRSRSNTHPARRAQGARGDGDGARGEGEGEANATERPVSRARGRTRGIPLEWMEEAATAVMESSRRLAALTDDLLDATRLQANRLELRPEPLELGALVRRVVKRLQITTRLHAINAIVPEEPMVVVADVQRVEQVLTNLLSNAIKYSPDGGPIEVEVALDLTRDTTRVAPASASVVAGDSLADGTVPAQHQGTRLAGMTRVAVRDYGMGIPNDQQGRIFERFGRADNARDRGIAGTGLGLFISRELIERLGGQLWFASSEVSGTTFTFELPGWIDLQE